MSTDRGSELLPTRTLSGLDVVSLLRAYQANPDQRDMGDSATLAAALEVIVRRVAREVAFGGNPTVREEFIEQALADLLTPRRHAGPQLRAFNPDTGPLEAWLAVTLRNLWRSRLRRLRRLLPTVAIGEREASAPVNSPTPWGHAIDLLGIPFPEGDLNVIRGWPSRDRVEALSMSGLYVKLPSDVWELFLAEYEQTVRIVLPRPFPPLAVTAAADPRSRTRPLATALGIDKPNTLSVRWGRVKQRLEELIFIRHLREAHR
jgi:DNA-directed RNA polymerase specialized sigma24 family protein